MENLHDDALREDAVPDDPSVVDDDSRATAKVVVDKLMLAVDVISDGHPMYAYQRPFARRLIESIVLKDGALLTALFSRQSGKSETVANVVATLMIMLPVLARVYPKLLGRFKKGLWVGAFAPVDDQADTLCGRIISRLTSKVAIEVMRDPAIGDELKSRGRTTTLRSGSLVRKQTCHPRARIEGRTYHLILIDEAQGADERMVSKSIRPMGASTRATIVMTGTPSYVVGIFYKEIQNNKRRQSQGGLRRNHFEADYRAAGKANRDYAEYVKDERERLGDQSDEFRMSYMLVWLLDKGMFVTTDTFAQLADISMQTIKYWHKTPVVVGIDPARRQDSTVVTVVWVDWDRPDEYGMCEHRIINWLDLQGMDWETQYHKIVEFLACYNVYGVGIDDNGVGDVVAERLRVLMPHANIVNIGSQPSEQSKRWKHLNNLIEKRMIGWPAHAKTRNLRTFKRFRTQMEDLQVEFKGPNMLAAAPNASGAYDDYADSLALACVLSLDQQTPEVIVTDNPFYASRR